MICSNWLELRDTFDMLPAQNEQVIFVQVNWNTLKNVVWIMIRVKGVIFFEKSFLGFLTESVLDILWEIQPDHNYGN